MKRTLLGLTAAAVAGLATVVPAATASAAAGPDYCLDGYVWRQAGPTDYVCVRASARSQAAADNAAATRRWISGDDGPHTCVAGYVWRKAFAGDEVCVTPAVQWRAATDNAQASTRWVTTRLTVTSYVDPVEPGKPVLSDSDLPKIMIKGDHFNYGTTKLYIYRPNHQIIWQGTAKAAGHKGIAGGSFSVKTGVIDCQKLGSTDGFLAYAQAQDGLSGRWSDRHQVKVGCTVA
ncbi:hypothetical protein [Nonomuraea sp. NPDC049141]|uniref:hypothetical protein n=1 Tax=unclassified Nonomuraea TaxID=2593643 RepID=UPI0033DA93C0